MARTELVAHVTEEDVLIDFVPRDQAHNTDDLLLHRETMQLVHPWGDSVHFWMQKRSDNKTEYAGYWTLSVTCHVNKSDISELDKLGYLTAGKREGPEELHIEIENQKLIKVLKIETPKNRAMAGLVVAESKDTPRPDPEEVSEVKLYNKLTIQEIVHLLTPAAYVCLQELGILQ